MWQFLKKSSRTKNKILTSPNNLSSATTSLCTAIEDEANLNSEDLLLQAEKLCESNIDFLIKQQNRYLNHILRILTDKIFLSYFVQFLETKEVLPLIKFWLEAESFKSAAKLSNETNYLSTKQQHKRELSEFFKSVDTTETELIPSTLCEITDELHNHYVLSKSNSLDTYNSKEIDSCLLDKEYLSQSNSNIDSSVIEEEKQGKNGLDSIKNNQVNNNNCDMERSLTDDEKSQLRNKKQLDETHENESRDKKSNENESHNNYAYFQGLITTDAIRIFRKYFLTKSSDSIDIPVSILSSISLVLCVDNNISDDMYKGNGADKDMVALTGDYDVDCTEKTNNSESSSKSIANLFDKAQLFVINQLETEYLNEFLESKFYCKYYIDCLTTDNLKMCDILQNECALFYFMEFLEQEQHNKKYLEFWISAINFKKHFHQQQLLLNNNYDKEQAQKDALILYEKYFSLQATNSLKMSDSVRFRIEENICCKEEDTHKILNCFDYPLIVIEIFMEKKYLKRFCKSQLFSKYLSDLFNKINECEKNDKTENIQHQKKVMGTPRKSRHRKTFSDCTNDNSQHVRTTTKFNTLFELPGGTNKLNTNNQNTNKTKIRSTSTSDMQIITNQLHNPDLLWRRNSINGLSFGRINSLGRYERDFDMEPTIVEKPVTTAGNKIKKAVRKLVNLREENVQEEIAWQIAEMIVKDVTNVTLNVGEQYNNHLNSTN